MITGCLQDLSYEARLGSCCSAAICVVNDSSHTWTLCFSHLVLFCICFLSIFFLVQLFQLYSLSLFMVSIPAGSVVFPSHPPQPVSNCIAVTPFYPVNLSATWFLIHPCFVCRWRVWCLFFVVVVCVFFFFNLSIYNLFLLSFEFFILREKGENLL